ncbi:hypothetical protein ACKI2N_012515 [Cupriavidus sp. 30B13]|uniref:hypothetical protein n=1 Tax=Cupriavidus sp. 30B13 TaxID=3384241 RepID=UPI003B91D736
MKNDEQDRGSIDDATPEEWDRASAAVRAGVEENAPQAGEDALTAIERQALVALVECASFAFHVADDGEDDGSDTIKVPRSTMLDLEAALDKLDDLPDDRPGCTMGPSGRAEWALRRLFGGTTVMGQENGMVEVCKHDADAYCRILHVLGMEEEGDAVAEVERLVRDGEDARPVGKLVVSGPLHEWHPESAAFDMPSGTHPLYATPQPAAQAVLEDSLRVHWPNGTRMTAQ